MHRPLVALAGTAALIAVPSVGLAQGGAPAVPTSGTGAGYAWTTFSSGSAMNAGVITSGFGGLWVPSDDGTAVTVIDPATGGIAATYPLTGVGAPSSAVQAGNYVWIAGSARNRTLVTGIDQTGTVRRRFTAPARSATVGAGGPTYSGIGLASGAGSVWVSDQNAGRVYAISPSTGKLVRTITTPSPRSVAVQGGRVWVTNTEKEIVTVFRASNGAKLATVKAPNDPNVMTPAGGAMWVLSNAGAQPIGLTSFKPLKGKIGVTSYSGWASAVATPSGIWASNYVAQAVLLDLSTGKVAINASWSNNDAGGMLAVSGPSAWVANGSQYAFPLGFGVTQITPATTQ